MISRFTRESTFIARELVELHQLGIRLDVYSLRRPSRDDRHWFATALPGARLAAPPYLLSAEVLAAAASTLSTQPRLLGGLLRRVLRDSSAHPRVLLRTLAVVPKSLAIARDVQRRGAVRVHSHWATVAATSGWIAATLSRRRFSLTAHAWDITFDDCLHRVKMSAADWIVTCNSFGRAQLLERHGAWLEPKVRLIYHGLDLDSYSPPADGRREESTILAVGRLTEQKGFHVLVEACRQLRDAGVPFTCEIAGSDADMSKRLRRDIEAADLSARVRLLGFMEPPALIPFYQRATVLAAPTVVSRRGETDGLPNVILEAMACGAPVVGTTAAGLPEAILHGRTGWLVPPNDPGALADALRRILGEPEARRRMGAEARRSALDRFDVRRNTAALRDLLLGNGLPTAGAGRAAAPRHADESPA